LYHAASPGCGCAGHAATPEDEAVLDDEAALDDEDAALDDEDAALDDDAPPVLLDADALELLAWETAPAPLVEVDAAPPAPGPAAEPAAHAGSSARMSARPMGSA
jgi:hypothetical protein